jgi:cytoskeletal protein CcmA (bactofilin family)
MEKNQPTDTTPPPEPVTSGGLETGESLEDTETSSKPTVQASPEKVKEKKRPIVQRLLARLNIYLLLFILIVVLAVGLVLVGIQKGKKAATVATISNQQLSQDELNKLKGTDSVVGDAKQTLNIESNAVFAGKVLFKDSIDVAGTIKVGGALNLPGITVSGTSNFDQIFANKLSIAGDTNINGQLNVQKGLTVTGGASFGGPISAPQLTVQSLQLNSDLQINKHLDAGGPTPSKADGGGLGGGGTTSISGTDTAGTVAINFGSGASSTGCYITVNFTSKYPSTPHVVIAATSGAAAQLNYYASRTNTSFQICSAGGSASGNATFDYIVID